MWPGTGWCWANWRAAQGRAPSIQAAPTILNGSQIPFKSPPEHDRILVGGFRGGILAHIAKDTPPKTSFQAPLLRQGARRGQGDHVRDIPPPNSLPQQRIYWGGGTEILGGCNPKFPTGTVMPQSRRLLVSPPPSRSVTRMSPQRQWGRRWQQDLGWHRAHLGRGELHIWGRGWHSWGEG